MSEEKRIYSQILATLESRSDEINKAFIDRADGEIIDLGSIGDLINDLSIIFDTDLEEAKEFISYDNDNVSKYFDLDNINFNDFMELIKMWLQKKTSEAQSQTAINQEEDNDNNILDKPISVQNEGFEGNETERNHNEESNTLVPPNTYRTNREILDELLMRHKAHLQVKFYQLRHPDIEAITLNDYFTFLQDCFILDGLVLYENSSDTQDLFTRDDYHEKLTQIVNKYHDEVKGTRHTVGEEELLLTFNECFDIIDYWFQTDENVILVNPKKKASAAVNQSTDGQSHVKDLLLETIEKYQQMINEASTEVEKQILQGTIDTLYEKLNKLEAGPKTSDDESRLLQDAKIQKKKEEKRMKALRDIFDFYSKQQLNAGKAPTFDRIEKQFSSINLGKLSVIIKNFQMKIDQFKLKETFKKVARSEFVTFEEFCDLFQKISKDAELIKDPKIVKPNYEKMKEYKPDSYKTSPVPKALGKVDFKKIEKRKTDNQKIEEIWDHMGLYNGSYRNNLNTVQLAFNSHDKETFRIPPDSLTYKLKVRGLDGKSSEEIKEAIVQRNEMRRAVRDVKLIEKSLLKNYRDPSTGKQTSRREHSISERKEESTYATIMANKPKGNLPEKKLTFNQVQKYKQNEIKTIGAEDRFDPRDLIDDNDDEDNIYLAEYNIIPDPKNNEQPIQETADIFEETAKLETNIRKARPIPGKYSRMPVTKSKTRIERIGTGPTHQLAEINTEKKPMTLNDIDYRNPMPVTASSNHSEFKRPQLGVSQSVKHNLGVSKHLASIYEYSNKNLDQSHHSVTRSIQMPTGMGMSHEPSQFDPRKAASNVALNRAYQVQAEALRKENAMMANLLSMQNNKIEKGLRVARK